MITAGGTAKMLTGQFTRPAHSLMVRPVIAGPSQICCPASHRFPEDGHHAVQLHRLPVGWLTISWRHGR